VSNDTDTDIPEGDDLPDDDEGQPEPEETDEERQARFAASDEKLRELIGYILGQIVSKPDEVKIGLSETHKRPVYEVRVAADDVGVVIGRSGRTINAIRTLLRGVPDAPDRVWLELIEEDEGRGRKRRDDSEGRFDEGSEGERGDDPSHADDAPESRERFDEGRGGDDRPPAREEERYARDEE
jgi:predicted RNA-binding protein YlqC (UPF0109 family)